MPTLCSIREAGIFADDVDAGYFYWISLQALSGLALRAVSITCVGLHLLASRKDANAMIGDITIAIPNIKKVNECICETVTRSIAT
jgi:hypothetical protein